MSPEELALDDYVRRVGSTVAHMLIGTFRIFIFCPTAPRSMPFHFLAVPFMSAKAY